MRTKLIILGLVMAGQCALAQVDPNAYGYYVEALRYSQTQFGGTARFQGVAGANTALGGDITAAYTNPAGLGFSTKSQLSLSPSLVSLNANTTFQGQRSDEFKLNFNFNHLGGVFATQNDPDNDWRSKAFAITFTRLNNFNNNISYSGINNQNTLVDAFIENTDGRTWSDMNQEVNTGINTISGLAYETYLINPQGGSPNQNTYSTFAFDRPDRPGTVLPDLNQSERIERSGAQNQWNFAYGANYKDRFYIGASVGWQTLRFEQTKAYTEKVLDPAVPLNSFTLNEKLTQRGSGVNFALGMILRPVNALRLGVNLVTPTFLKVNETYSADITVNYNNYTLYDGDGKVIRQFSPGNPVQGNLEPLEDSYALRTPYRLNAGAAFFFGKSGFISGDIEYVDYAAARLSNSAGGTQFGGDNTTIRNIYNPAFNFRLGGEIATGDFRVRAGAAYYQNGRYDNIDLGRDGLITNAGVGIHKKTHYFDLTLTRMGYKDVYRPYTLFQGGAPVADVKNSRIGGVISAGFFF